MGVVEKSKKVTKEGLSKEDERLVKKVAKEFSEMDIINLFPPCKYGEPRQVLLSLRPYLFPQKRHDIFAKGYIVN